VSRPSECESALGLCPDEAMEVEHIAKNPPPSLVPRIHAVWIKILAHTNPLLPYELSHGCPAASEWQTCCVIFIFILVRNILVSIKLWLFDDRIILFS